MRESGVSKLSDHYFCKILLFQPKPFISIRQFMHLIYLVEKIPTNKDQNIFGLTTPDLISILKEILTLISLLSY